MKQTIWFLLDDRNGSVNQARGVENALNKEKYIIEEKKISYNFLAALPNFIRGKTLLGVKSCDEAIFNKIPDIVVSSSRRTVPVARYIKKMSRGKTKLVQLMHPGRVGMKDFSLIFVPEHDRGKKNGDNVEYIVGCAHRITPDSLNQAHEKWKDFFAKYQKPLTAVIVGGAIKKRKFTDQNASDFGKMLKHMYDKTGGTLLVTTSRRTGLSAQSVLMNEIKDIPCYSYLWGDKSENPYMGFLSEADNIVVTGDSVSMCSEAVGTGKPIYIFCGENWLSKKHERFVNSLYNKGFAAPLGEKFKNNSSQIKSRNPAQDIAKKIEATL